MRVSNMTSPRSGSPVANQYVIENDGVELFQSYQTPIAKKEGDYLVISSDYNYSRTTSKYFWKWVGNYGLRYEKVEVSKWLKKANYGDTTDDFGYLTIKYVEEL